MTTPTKKVHDTDEPEYVPDEMAQYETAVETMDAYVGHLRREIWCEEEKKQPK
jgi:hypothetical protein